MNAALVFESASRTYWLERGHVWRWARVSHRWWPIPGASRLGGRLIKGDELTELVAERGTPFAPRVEAGAWLPCSECGQVCGERRTYLGARPFCSVGHADSFARRQPLIDRQS